MPLYGRRLPDGLRANLDIVPREKFPKPGEPTHALSRVSTGAAEAAVYAEYRRINPSDRQHNRGAYIAVGCWAAPPLTPAQAVEALDRIEAIHDDLAGKRDPATNEFPRDFRLSAYAAPDPAESCRGQWADLISRAASGPGSGSKIWTSEEVRQGALAKLLANTETAEAGPHRPSARNNRSGSARLLEALLREAGSEAPQTRRNLQKLARLEEERTRIIGALTRTVHDGPRRAPGAGAHPVVPKWGIALPATSRKIVFAAAVATVALAIIAAMVAIVIVVR